VALPEFQTQTQKAKAISEWQPVAKNYAAVGTTLSPVLAQIDGGQALNAFTQTMLAGKTDAKTALQTLQTQLTALIK
jgi:multiple sugar transport system substrate-binding protein